MSKRMWTGGLLCVVTIAMFGSRGMSQDKPMDPAMVAMMAKMMAYATPGANHQHLGAMVGTFECDTKFWTDPNAPAEKSTGVMVTTWMLGRRYLKQEYKGEAMGAPFEGFGMMGYDNSTEKFFSTWMDTFSTGMFLETGSCDASGKNFTLTGKNYDPQLGKKRRTKTTLEVVNNNKHIMRMYGKTPDGKEFMNFEMIATKN